MSDERKQVRYRCSFTGRTKGAIGIMYRIVDYVYAASPDEAFLALHDKYDHVQGLRAVECPSDSPEVG